MRGWRDVHDRRNGRTGVHPRRSYGDWSSLRNQQRLRPRLDVRQNRDKRLDVCGVLRNRRDLHGTGWLVHGEAERRFERTNPRRHVVLGEL